MNNRWTMNKLGLVNFWYYDVEEFNLLQGKLLLRGSNGSGKSVTMQSFIPLLLDGNKAPERLDPFGTKARTISNYLLDENTDEKTAYLYIEFKRAESENYITIGMGIKAIKNKTPQSWYFILSDGRRINKDVFLYREAGEKLALTKKQLQNELGDGNFYTELQREYMKKVNEYLFGFEDIEAYEELLNLLISIRSPKLSKDFKPTEIYKILTDSLKVLSEEDLRPISDSMENMDSYKSTLDENKKSLKAAQNIKYHYDKYNSYILKEKASKVIQQKSKVEEVNKKKQEEIKKTSKYSNELVEKHKIKEELENELKCAEEKYEGLMDRQELRDKKDLLETEKRIDNNKKNLNTKEDNLTQKKSKEKEIEYDLKDEVGKRDLLKVKLKENLEELDDLAEEALFQEGENISKEAIDTIETFDLSFLELSAGNYGKNLKDTEKLLKEYEFKKQKLEEVTRERDEKAKDFDEAKKDMRRIEELFLHEKEEYKVKLVKWNDNNRIFNLEQDQLNNLFKNVDKVEDNKNLNSITENFVGFFGEKKNTLGSNIFIKNRQIEELKQEIKILEEEIKDLRNKKDISPERTEGVIKNRERLKEDGIAFLPLYKAIDFNKNCDEGLKNKIEAALVNMGLIDALIVDEKNKYKALDFKENMEDKYIFCEPNFMRHNISHYLSVDKAALGELSFQAVDNVLQGIFLEDNTLTFLDEHGNYGIGVLNGRASSHYKQKYIGEASRKKHREELIEKLLSEISLINASIKLLEGEKTLIEEDIKLLTLEYEKKPSLQDIEEGITLIKGKERELESLESNLTKINDRLFIVEGEFRELKKAVFEKTSRLRINTLEHIENAIEALEEYLKVLRSIMLKQGDIKHLYKLIQMKEETLESLRADLDLLYSEIHVLNRNIKEDEVKALALRKVLETSNIQDIQKEIEDCIKIKDTHPKKITDLSERIGKLKSDIEKYKDEIEKLKVELEKEENGLTGVIEVFKEEYDLELFILKEQGEVIELCQKLKEEIQTSEDKNREHYSNNLIESINKNSGELREFNMKISDIFSEGEYDEEIKWLRNRKELRCKIQGKDVGFLILLQEIQKNIDEQSLLISEEERRIFEDVLMNTISQKVKAKIYQSKSWVSKINSLMESMDTSSSLKLSLTWSPKKADSEGQLDVSDLIDILERGDRCTEEELKNLAAHFSIKVKEALRSYEGSGEVRNYHSIIKEVLDYRQWYEFKLFFTKKGERKKELTNNAFFQFSGGEKAMSMYIPLFSAIYARYEKANVECPRIISMDEAFAGVDENNIRDMFRLLKHLNLDYILNSQILWGDYDTVGALAIAELIREENDDVVTVLRYEWNGKEKTLIS